MCGRFFRGVISCRCNSVSFLYFFFFQIQEERALSVGGPVIHQGRQGSSFGLLPADVTSCVLSSRCYCVMVESIWMLVSQSRTLEITWANVSDVKSLWEMISQQKRWNASFKPITKMSLCNQSSTAEGKLHFWCSKHPRVCHAWVYTEKLACTLD